MITYRGMRANTVEEALTLFGETETVYIAANYYPFIAEARHHARIRKVKELMKKEVFGYQIVDKDLVYKGEKYHDHHIDLYL